MDAQAWSLSGIPAARAAQPDPGASAATASDLAIGPAGTAGAIDAPGDVDWYRVALVAGATYRVTMRGLGAPADALADAVIRGVRRGDTLLPFTAADGATPAAGAQVEFVAGASGLHYIDVAGAFGHAGRYSLAIEQVAIADASADRMTASSIVVDAAPAESRIDRTGDVDWHRIDLDAGKTYRIEALGAASGWGSLGDPRIVGIYDAAGRAIPGTVDASSGLGADARIAFAPRATGVHYVAIDDGRRTDIPGTYRVSVRDDGAWADAPDGPRTPLEARIGGSVLGTIDGPRDVDWFHAALLPGRSYRIDLKSSAADGSPLPDPKLLGLFDAQGRLLAGTANDDYAGGLDARVTLTSPGGSLYIAAASADGRGGVYRLSVTDVTPPDLPADTTTEASIAPNAIRTGRVECAGDVDWIRTTLTAGQSYAIGLQRDPSSLQPLANPMLRGIFDAAGRAIADTANDDWGTGYDARVAFTPATSGAYFIAAAGHGDAMGDYVLSVARTAQVSDGVAGGTATTAGIVVGGAVDGRIDSAFDEDWFRVALTRGETYAIDLRGAPSGLGTLTDPRFAGVFDAAGRLVAGTPNDDAPGTLDSRVVFAPATGGTYYLAAGGHGAQDGTYRLSIMRLDGATPGDAAADATTTATVAAGGSAAGAIERLGDVDWIRLRMSAGQVYTATLRGDPAQGQALADGEILGVFDTRGLALRATLEPDIGGATPHDARAVFAAASSADAFIALRAQDGGTGAYRLAVEAVADATAPRLLSTTPHDGVSGAAPPAAIAFVFDEPVKAGAGRIAIEGGGSRTTIDVADGAQAHFEGTRLTLTPTLPLSGGTAYSVTLPRGSVEDLAGNDYAGNLGAPLDFVTGGSAPATPRDSWTLMVYMAADNDLEPFALRDLNEMESVRGLDAAGVNVLVMADRASGYSVASGNWTDTRRAQIQPDGNATSVGSLAAATTSVGERNMGDPATLTEFIDWARGAAPAQHYGLIVWDHGGGLQGAAWDDASKGDRLTIREIRAAIDAGSVGHFDLVGFDCCQMAMTELAFALQDRADIFVASQENEPGDGWAYDRVLGRLAEAPRMTGTQLASTIVDSYGAAYAGQLGITLSATDLGELDRVEAALDRFVEVARSASAADRTALGAAAAAALRFPSGGGAPWRDLVDFMEEVETRTATPALDDAAHGVILATRAAVFAHAGTVPEAEGLSINLPVGSQPVQDDYTAANFAFLAKVDWSGLLAIV